MMVPMSKTVRSCRIAPFVGKNDDVTEKVKSLNVNSEEGLEHGSAESMLLVILKHQSSNFGEEL
jgi:hypothetical protein